MSDVYRISSSHCIVCPLKKNCLSDKTPNKQMYRWEHFLVRSKKKVLGENALIMFTYNFKRLLNLIRTTLFKKLCIAIKENDLTRIREDIAAYI